MIKKMLPGAVIGALVAVMASPATALDFYYQGSGDWTEDDTFGIPVTYDPGVACWGTPQTAAGQSCAYINRIGSEPQNDNPAFWNDLEPRDPDQPLLIDGEVTVSHDINLPGTPADEDLPWAVMGYLTHENNVIDEFWDEPNTDPEGGSGTAADDWLLELDYALTIFDNETDKNELFSFEGPFVVEHWETLNGQGDDCPRDGDVSDCDDRFRFAPGTIENHGNLDDPFIREPIGEFMYDGKPYEVRITGFICSADLDCLGDFWSEEGTFRPSAVVAFEVHEIPEPATYALLGAGLLGIGFANRRRKERKS